MYDSYFRLLIYFKDLSVIFLDVFLVSSMETRGNSSMVLPLQLFLDWWVAESIWSRSLEITSVGFIMDIIELLSLALPATLLYFEYLLFLLSRYFLSFTSICSILCSSYIYSELRSCKFNSLNLLCSYDSSLSWFALDKHD